jgi:hypothetical protein
MVGAVEDVIVTVFVFGGEEIVVALMVVNA